MTARRPVVLLLMRKESPGYYSVERLFETLLPFLSRSAEVRIARVPCQSSGLWRCVRNIAFTARQQADIIHVTGDIYYCALGVRRRRCVLTVLDFCMLDRLSGARKRAFAALWYALPLRWARHVTALSASTRTELERRYPWAIGRAEVVPCCVDEAFRVPREISLAGAGKLRLLQVGTARHKNLERVAAAVSGLPVRLRIIGPLSGEQRSFLDSLDLEWTSAERLTGAEVVREYHDSDVLIFASTYEGFGLPVVEAQASGLPVITSDVAPMNEIAGDGALLVDPRDEAQIRAAVERLLESTALAQQLSERGRRNATRFDAMGIAGQYAGIYARACRGADLRDPRGGRQAGLQARWAISRCWLTTSSPPGTVSSSLSGVTAMPVKPLPAAKPIISVAVRPKQFRP